jgi:tRNA(Ile)-lysidine synthase
VLCDILYSNGYQFSIAHCNFQLRDSDSNSDEAFVKELAVKYNVPFYVKRFETNAYSTVNKLSIQVAARQLRYDWFNELLEVNKLNYLLTAHHADDNIETVLMNLFKGTGIAGLHGILSKKNKLVRPLLFATKKDIVQYANEHSLGWVEDASNATDKYTRNFFRHQVIPLVEQAVPGAAANVSATIERMGEVELLYNDAIALHKKKLLEHKSEEVHIPVLKFAKATPFNTIAFEILKDYGFAANQLSDILTLLSADTGKYIASATHRIIRNRKWLIIAPNQSASASNILIEAEDKIIVFENGKLQLSFSNDIQPSTENSIATLDAKHIMFPLLFRKWKQGDYFYPLGMPKKKKIARFLIDLKLSKTDKEKVWVIESNQKIIWVAGYRIDDRFKLTPSTQQMLKIKLMD